MTTEEIEEKYDGKWVFIVQAEGELITGWEENQMPVVVADKKWEGSETGIYDTYMHDTNLVAVQALSLLPRDPNTFYGFWEVPVDDHN
ncbi:MAG: hypothetical protein FWG64_05190, partial [Firmicutes bacterium]|nr:hypothetical protein [Bacillota bacterium]